ncbi:Gamma-butyrobetaine dioxygenase [Ceratobasidium theobromae]|uniref:trimethyllysine dioxygenase n=1 Tax=Ceratobasidium theobromae TaxID=1582974 RepID=A0A5N5QIV9_9AGAM|nr:Gamma-butyrobetaine dioxygenase [Ceratobasidium theobromae]
MISLRRAFSLVRYPLIRTTSTVQTSQLNLHCDGSAIHVSGPSIKSLSLPVPWLRDSCQCPRCVYPQTEHKLMHTGYFLTSIPSSISLQPDALAVSWSGPREENGHHDSLYPLSFLERYAESTGQIRRASQFEDVLARKPWDILSYPEPQFIEYQDFVQDPLPTFLRILKYGFVMFRGVPTEGTELGDVEGSTVQNLAEAFGVVRATRPHKLFAGLAHGSHASRLLLHIYPATENIPRFIQTPPRIQFLHCIKNQVKGGRTVFVDALKSAHDLWYQDREAFNLLAKTPIPFQFTRFGNNYYQTHFTFQLAPEQPHSSQDAPPEIEYINYTPSLQAPMPINSPQGIYAALGKYGDLLARPEVRFEHQLRPGECVAFDNRRLLHGRSAFSDSSAGEGDTGEIKRWLKGCYLEWDDLLERTRGLLAKRQS